MMMMMMIIPGRYGGTNFILRITEKETRQTLREHDDDYDEGDDYDDDYPRKRWRDQLLHEDQGTGNTLKNFMKMIIMMMMMMMIIRGRDGGNNIILRIKERETRLTLREHDDDYNEDDDDYDDDYPRKRWREQHYLEIQRKGNAPNISGIR